jgi:glycerate 2-kinase
MSDPSELRRAARQIFDAALLAVDARAATSRALKLNGSVLRIVDADFDLSSSRIYVVGIGKAAFSMALGIDDAIGARISGGIISAPAQLEQGALPATRWQQFVGGHPLPNQASVASAQAVLDLLDKANAERAVVIFLISGGGSAMVEWPVNDSVTLADLREANRLLIGCGASIGEINAVRRRFSAVKGGALARRANQARIVTLLVSDTNPGDEASVASGPTLAAPANSPEPMDVINRYRLESAFPSSVMQAISQKYDGTHQASDLETNRHFVLLDNHTAIQAAAENARAIGFTVAAAPEICEQAIGEGCVMLLSRLASLSSNGAANSAGQCLVSGGEFSCPVSGDGRGGRNLETVLRCAVGLDQDAEQRGQQTTVVLGAGSDGIDGNSPAAGAIADERTVERSRLSGFDAQTLLQQSDSYSLFEQLNDAIITGPTGTNVRDIRILLRSRKRA